MSNTMQRAEAQLRNLSQIAYAQGWTGWLYRTTHDALDECVRPGYFDPVRSYFDQDVHDQDPQRGHGDVVTIRARDGVTKPMDRPVRPGDGRDAASERNAMSTKFTVDARAYTEDGHTHEIRGHVVTCAASYRDAMITLDAWVADSLDGTLGSPIERVEILCEWPWPQVAA